MSKVSIKQEDLKVSIITNKSNILNHSKKPAHKVQLLGESSCINTYIFPNYKFVDDIILTQQRANVLSLSI